MMQQSKTVETWVGLFVALGLAALFFLAMKVSNLAELQVKDNSYRVYARFQNAGSLKIRSSVTMAGVRIGRVSSIKFDKENYEAVVEMRIDPEYDTIPSDTTANVLTAGLLGEQYVGLTPGGSEEYLKNGDEIELSQSAMVLEEIISRFLFNKAEGGSEKKNSSADNNSDKQSELEPSPDDGETQEMPRSQTKASDEAGVHKPKSQLLPKPEKNNTEFSSKQKELHAKPSEETHATRKPKNPIGKEGGEQPDVTHKSKQTGR